MCFSETESSLGRALPPHLCCVKNIAAARPAANEHFIVSFSTSCQAALHISALVFCPKTRQVQLGWEYRSDWLSCMKEGIKWANIRLDLLWTLFIVHVPSTTRLILLAFVCPSGCDKLIKSNYCLVIWHGFGFWFQIFRTNQDVFKHEVSRFQSVLIWILTGVVLLTLCPVFMPHVRYLSWISVGRRRNGMFHCI